MQGVSAEKAVIRRADDDGVARGTRKVPWRWTLRRRLFLVALAALIPGTLALGITVMEVNHTRVAGARETALRGALVAGHEVGRIVEVVGGMLVALGRAPVIRQFLVPQCDAYLAEVTRLLPQITAAVVLDTDLQPRCGAVAEDALRAVHLPHSSSSDPLPRADQIVVGEFAFARLAGRPLLPIAAPIEVDGTLRGYLVGGLDLAWFGRRLKERDLPSSASITVADRNGVILAREPFPGRFVATRIPSQWQSLVRASEPGVLTVTSQDGTRRVLGYMPPAALNNGLYVSFGVPESSASMNVNRVATFGLLAVLSGGLLAFTLAWFVGHRFIEKPVERLLVAETAWRAGDYAARTAMDPRKGEIEQVGATFDRLFETLAARELERDEALRALRAKTNELETVLSTVPAAVWFTYDPEVRTVIRNKYAAELMGHAPRSIDEGGQPARYLRTLKDGKELPAQDFTLRRAMRGERIEGEETVVVLDDGTSITLLSNAMLLRDEAGAIVGAVAVSIDITERKKVEEQRNLLVRELHHRVKNTFAVVQALANQTLRRGEVPEAIRQALAERLRALADAHLLFVGREEDRQTADLREIVALALRPYAASFPGRFHVDGPLVMMSGKSALAFALILHELCTNAVKYGALSVEGGRVSIRWRTVEIDGERGLSFRWAESGGPPVAPPARAGFGLRLIQRGLAADLRARVVVRFEPTGVVCEITPQSAVTAPPERAV